MSEQITTPEELDALPVGSVVMTETRRGFGGGYEQRVWMRHGGQGSPLIHDWQSTDGGFQRVGEPEHARGMWAVNRNVTVLYRPDAPSLGADDQAGGPLEGAPKPSAETVADALIRYETGGCCGFGTTCGLCDCGRSDQTPERQRDWDAHQLDRARAVLALIPPQRCVPSEDGLANVLRDILVRVFEQDKDIVAQDAARAVLALFAGQHTVAQAKAEALREAAVEFDREAAEDWMSTDRPATDDAATRWLRNYHGSIDSTALLLAFRAGQKAAQPDGESSWIGDHLRARAAAIESGADR